MATHVPEEWPSPGGDAVGDRTRLTGRLHMSERNKGGTSSDSGLPPTTGCRDGNYQTYPQISPWTAKLTRCNALSWPVYRLPEFTKPAIVRLWSILRHLLLLGCNRPAFPSPGWSQLHSEVSLSALLADLAFAINPILSSCNDLAVGAASTGAWEAARNPPTSDFFP